MIKMIKMSYHSLLTTDDLYNINLTHNKGGRIYLPRSIVSAMRNLVNTPFEPIKFVVYYSKYDRQQQTQQTKWVPYLFRFLPTRLLKEIKSSFYWPTLHTLCLSRLPCFYSVCLSVCLSVSPERNSLHYKISTTRQSEQLLIQVLQIAERVPFIKPD